MHLPLTDEQREELEERLRVIQLQDLPESVTDYLKTQPIWGAAD